MKILYLNALYPTSGDRRAIGGAETFSVRLTQGLLAAGHEITIVRSGTTSTESIEYTPNGIAVHSMPCRNVYPMADGRPHGPASRLLWHFLEDRGRIGADFQHLIQTVQPNLLHTNNVVGLTTDVWRVAREAGLPIVHTLHDYYLTCPKVMRIVGDRPCAVTCRSCRILSQQRRSASRNVDVVVGVSQRMLDIHRAEGLFADTLFDVILNPAPARTGPMPSRPLTATPVFGYLGRQAVEKGIFTLLNAFASLQPGAARLIIAGTVNPAVRDWVERHAPCPADITFTGYTTQDVFFSQIDVGVFPSLWEEPCCMGIGEGFAYGVPSIGSTRGGIPEILEGGRLGWLFHPETGELVALLADLVANPTKITAKADIVRSNRQETLGDQLVSAYLAAYEQVGALKRRAEARA